MILFCARAHMVSVSEVSEAFREASEELDNQVNEEGNALACLEIIHLTNGLY